MLAMAENVGEKMSKRHWKCGSNLQNCQRRIDRLLCMNFFADDQMFFNQTVSDETKVLCRLLKKKFLRPQFRCLQNPRFSLFTVNGPNLASALVHTSIYSFLPAAYSVCCMTVKCQVSMYINDSYKKWFTHI